MYKYLLLLISLLASANTTLASYRFEYTSQARAAYERVISLRFEEANGILQQMKIEDPQNMIIYHIENYVDFFTIFINEEEEEFDRLEKNKHTRLANIQNGPKDSPYYLYTQAEINLQWALARLKFEEYLAAFKEVSKAYKLLIANQKKYPDFIPNKKSLGILHALIGTVPDNYKWGMRILGGMEGTIEQGRGEIKEVLEYAKTNDFIFEEETLVMYAFLMLHLKNKDQTAWDLLNSSRLDARTNPLACFTLANVAMRTGRNDEAIKLLENRPKGKTFHTFHYLEYMLGLAKLYRLDDDADQHILNYIQQYKGQNYIKEAYQKLAWFNLLQNKETAYKTNMQSCQTQGVAIIDGDKMALKEAKKNTLPNKILLKARLLFDGGYYKKAYELLAQYEVDQFATKGFQLEYTYRLGRITHKMNRYGKALTYYRATIDNGQKASYFYACNAALQMGLIYEKLEQYHSAEAYYNQCLSLKPNEYRTSLHQKAKAGKNRLKGLVY